MMKSARDDLSNRLAEKLNDRTKFWIRQGRVVAVLQIAEKNSQLSPNFVSSRLASRRSGGRLPMAGDA